jgi:hypothetical protein
VYFSWAPISTYGALNALHGTGFVEKAIWFSEAVPKEGTTVTIYTAVFNPHPETLSGTVVFYDKSVIIDKKSFSVPGNGVMVVSTNWNVPAGTHLIRAEILDPVLVSEGKESRIFVTDTKALSEEFSVQKSITISEKALPLPQEKTNTAEKTGTLDEVSTTVMGSLTTKAQSVDAWRSVTAETLSKKEVLAKEELLLAKEAPKATATINSDGITVSPTKDVIKTPLAHGKAFFFTFASYIFSHKILFYSITLIFLFLILRALWRRFSK